jgi:hypothetical protein
LSGYERRDALGKSYRDVMMCAQTEPEENERFVKILKSYTVGTVAMTCTTADGDLFMNLVSAKPIFDHHRFCRYIILLSFNVTKAVKTESINASSGDTAASVKEKQLLNYVNYYDERVKIENLLSILPDVIIPELDELVEEKVEDPSLLSRVASTLLFSLPDPEVGYHSSSGGGGGTPPVQVAHSSHGHTHAHTHTRSQGHSDPSLVGKDFLKHSQSPSRSSHRHLVSGGGESRSGSSRK